MPAALVIAAMSVFPIRTAYRKVRIGDWDMLEYGAVEQAFMASLWVGIAAIFYVYIVALFPVVWICFIRRHLMTARAWMASFLAIILCAFWYGVVYYLQNL